MEQYQYREYITLGHFAALVAQRYFGTMKWHTDVAIVYEHANVYLSDGFECVEVYSDSESLPDAD